MKYMKKRLDDEGVDNMRINLSVRELKLSAEPVCDFCGDPTPIYAYASYRMSTGETTQCWRWTACQICSDAIDREDFRIIEARALRRLQSLLPPLTKGSSLVLSAVRLAMEEFHRYVVRREDEPPR